MNSWKLYLMINTESQKTKYGIDFTKGFKKQFKKVIKQGKDIKIYMCDEFKNIVLVAKK